MSMYDAIDHTDAMYHLVWDRTGERPVAIYACTPSGTFKLGLHVGSIEHAEQLMAQGAHLGKDWLRVRTRSFDNASLFECGRFVD
jgi:hypothetical protein